MLNWIRSSTCSGGSCVEIAGADDYVLIRDGKNPERHPIVLEYDRWIALLGEIRSGDFKAV